VFDLQGLETQFIRLRQTSHDPTFPWTFAELSVHTTDGDRLARSVR
jgi:hypothetical protein